MVRGIRGQGRDRRSSSGDVMRLQTALAGTGTVVEEDRKSWIR